MSQVDLECRNFKCPSNKSGECLSSRVQLVPVGGLIDRLICVQCEREAPPVPKPDESPEGPAQSANNVK